MKRYTYIFFLILLLLACGTTTKRKENGAFSKEKKISKSNMDFSQIKETGELIVTTLSGPDTYYDYQGVLLGREYNLISNFAISEGLRLRIEVAHDTTEMFRLIASGNVDIIVFPLPIDQIRKNGMKEAGVTDAKKHTSWVVRQNSKELADALNSWWGNGTILNKIEQQLQPKSTEMIRRHVYSPFLSRDKGQISIYDELFQEAARTIGWDWRLIAAQAYQESAFDPQAISWAGAKGLMQLMPVTASSMGVNNVYDPVENVLGGTRYLRQLYSQFSDIPNREERLRFTLAAYNGGMGHIRDAMALAKKYGKQSILWQDVSFFVLKLQEPQYYRDPIVRYGYMIGQQTYDYVHAIMERYAIYKGGTPVNSINHNSNNTVTPSHKSHRILTPEDPEFTDN